MTGSLSCTQPTKEVCMMQRFIRDIVTRGVIGVSPETRTAEAIELMRAKSISSMVVLQGGKAVGMFTERDILRHLARHGRGFMEKNIGDIMSTPVFSVAEDKRLYEAFHIFTNHPIRHLVVEDANGAAVSVLTFSTVVAHVGDDFMVEFQPVSKIMSSVVYTVQADVKVHDVLVEMAERNISCVIHTVEDRPAGILTERDIARLAMERNDHANLPVLEVMSAPVLTMSKDALVHEAARKMREHKVRRIVLVDGAGKVAGLVTQSNIVRGLETRYIKVLKQVIRDKSEELDAASRHLREKSVYLDNILQSSFDMGIVATDKALTVVYFNPAAEKLLDLPAEHAVGRNARKFIEREGVEGERVVRALEKVHAGEPHAFQFDRLIADELRHIQGRISGIWDPNGELLGYVFTVQDITERKKAEENIRFMAYHDILTGLPNRVALDERLQLELAHAERNTTGLALMLLDLDRFKEVNDSMGHFAGDILLREFAGRLQRQLRESDTVARVGGDEFIVLLPNIKDRQSVLDVGRKILSTVESPFEIKGQDVRVELSLGIALYPEHTSKGRRLVQLADAAMYTAKKLGRDDTVSNMALYKEAPKEC